MKTLLPAIANQKGIDLTGILLDCRCDSYVDNSIYARSISTVGSVSINTSIKKYGTGSFFFGSNGYISVGSMADATPYPMTIEMWFYATNLGAVSNVFFNFNDGTAFATSIAYYNPGAPVFRVFSSSNPSNVNSITANAWHHIAFCLNTSSTNIWVDGSNVASSSNTTPTLASGGYNFWFGSGGYANSYIRGYIDTFRITKGIKYLTSFDPETTPGLAY